MTKKLIGIATIILILGIILAIGIRSIKAATNPTHSPERLHAVALLERGTAVHANLLLVDLELTQVQYGLEQLILSARPASHALRLTALQDLVTPDALTRTNVDLGLLGLNT